MCIGRLRNLLNFFVVFAALLGPVEALAGKRVALVIGNSAYKHAGELENPKNDAADMAAALKKLDFQVIDGIDLDKAAFDRRIRDFATALVGAEVAVLFYAGHGLQVGGQNYLVPTDAELTSAAALDSSRWCASISSSAAWSGKRRPTSCSWTPAATIRSPATSPAPWAPGRPRSGAGWPPSNRGSAR